MTKLRNSHKLGAVLGAILAFASFAVAADLRVEVTVRSANVRLEPALDSPVVGNAVMGLVLRCEKKTGEWYLVELPAGTDHPAVRGYLHESVVREVSSKGPAPKAAVAPKPAPVRTAVKPKPKPAAVKKAPARAAAARKKIYVRLGAGYASKSFDYSRSSTFPMYGESASSSERYAVDTAGLAIDAGIGFMFTPSLGVELAFTPASGKSAGTFAASFPHPFYFNLPREKEWTNDGLKYSGSELHLDALYAFPVTRKIGITVCAGGTYFMGVKIESLRSLDWAETGYPYFDLNPNPRYASFSANAFGFNAAAGADYRLSDGIAVNLNARYSSGSAKVKIEESEVSVPAGGLRATAGIKFMF